MKRILIVAVLGLASVSAVAQSMYDGINYSESNYYGTARSMALGNAMTAVGGDLGSVNINPAGSAVAGYSQFTITPGLTISSTAASYAPVAMGPFTANGYDSQTRFVMPNISLMLNFDTGNSYGLKNFTFGVVSNTTNTYSDRTSISGVNDQTSMMGESAFFCKDVSSKLLSDYNSGAAWTDVLAYKSGLISTYGGFDDQYIGSTELIYDDGTIGLGGPIRQSYYIRHAGSKSDIAINSALNFSDKFYLGINIGIPTVSYSESVSRNEVAQDPEDFRMDMDDVSTAFLDGHMRYNLQTVGEGIYAKVGFIWTPVAGLRLGGAVKTPTLMTMTERWRWDAACYFDGIKTSPEETPEGEYTYNMTSPFSFNLGAAYTLGNIAMLSVDYERTDFSSMKFSDVDEEFGFDSFADLNREIREYAGVTNAFRAGLEVKVIPQAALRLGYSFKNYTDGYGLDDVTEAFSGGVGYSSNGSFFADVAFRYNKYPDTWYYPYYDYLETRAPEVNISKGIMDFVFTLGWRF